MRVCVRAPTWRHRLLIGLRNARSDRRWLGGSCGASHDASDAVESRDGTYSLFVKRIQRPVISWIKRSGLGPHGSFRFAPAGAFSHFQVNEAGPF